LPTSYIIHSQTRWEQKFWMLCKEDGIKDIAEKAQNLQKKKKTITTGRNANINEY